LALGSAFEDRGRRSLLLLDLPLRHCQRLAGYVDRHSTVVPVIQAQSRRGSRNGLRRKSFLRVSG
jgi:hypothetical protein